MIATIFENTGSMAFCTLYLKYSNCLSSITFFDFFQFLLFCYKLIIGIEVIHFMKFIRDFLCSYMGMKLFFDIVYDANDNSGDYINILLASCAKIYF